jgi:hypothetical protein
MQVVGEPVALFTANVSGRESPAPESFTASPIYTNAKIF